MKTLLVAVFSVLLFGACAEEIVATSLRSDGTTNTWTAADLQSALGMVNRMYWRDMETHQGRKRWHGERLGQYILETGETNSLGQAMICRVDLYADGFVATNRGLKVHNTLVKDPEAIAKAAAEQKRKQDAMRAAWERANLPPELANLRNAQRENQTTQTITVIVGPEAH